MPIYEPVEDILTSPQWFLSTVFAYAHVKRKPTIFNNQFIKGSIEKDKHTDTQQMEHHG